MKKFEDKMKEEVYKDTDQALQMLDEGDFHSARDDFQKYSPLFQRTRSTIRINITIIL